jgi:DNA-directed RNA polymerase specialized sigma24 family protein
VLVPHTVPNVAPSEENGAVIIRRCIETEAESLLGTLAVYLYRAWPQSREEAWNRAHDVLAEVVTIALTKPQDFDPQRSARAWLLGIGNRVILRHREAVFAQRAHEFTPIRPAYNDAFSAEAVFDQLSMLSSPDVATTVEQADAGAALVAPLSPAARHVVRLGIIAGLQGDVLASALHCSPGAARVRLFRALRQLRAAWVQPTDSNAEGNQA